MLATTPANMLTETPEISFPTNGEAYDDDPARRRSFVLATEGGFSRDFNFWYPSWESWQFRRTLTYWIALLFGEGAILFVMGASFSLSGVSELAPDEEGKRLFESVLVQTPYFAGGVAFTVGAYCGILEVLNLPRRDHAGGSMVWCPSRKSLREARQAAGLNALMSYSSNFVGAIFFNINTTAGYVKIDDDLLRVSIVWGMATLGALAFTVGGVFDCRINQVWNINLSSPSWWVSVANTFGGIGFLISGVTGATLPSPAIYKWLVDFPYFIGSIAFLVGAIFQLWMWKNEQYGLARLPALNIPAVNDDQFHESIRGTIMGMHEEYGCGKSSTFQMPWLFMYELLASVSVIRIALVKGFKHEVFDSEVLQALTDFLLSHGILLLGSVIHHIPTKRPFNWLLMYMRFCLLLYTIGAVWSVVLQLMAILN